MKDLPPHSPGEEPRGPEPERLWPGEIDLTGATRQDDALADVIGDAIGEVESSGGEVPEWGARALARALANERDDPFSGALHHFAITGRADKDAMVRELAELSELLQGEGEIRGWIDWLGAYVIHLPDEPASTEPNPEQQEIHEDQEPDLDPSADGFGERVRHAFAEADRRGQPITGGDARAIAAALAVFLDSDSEMARFAVTGNANPILLGQECQTARRFTEHLPGAAEWITRFEQYLASRTDLGRQAGSSQPTPSTAEAAPAQPDEVKAGIGEHGPAFEAFLTLPNVDPSRDDLAQVFRDCYIGAYDSMDAIVRDLAEGVISEEEQARWAAEGLTLEGLIRASWDIVEYGGKFYVFSQ